MNLERMKQWVEGMISLPDDEFFLGDWGDWTTRLPGETKCRVCAGMRATMMPEFQKQGLQFDISRSYTGLAEFFGITYDEVDYIVSPTRYHSSERKPAIICDRVYVNLIPKEAAIAHIDKVITDNLEQERQHQEKERQHQEALKRALVGHGLW